MSKPFHGRIFCCTGLESEYRRTVESQIVSLGGEVFIDLMSSVQYLVVGDRKTEKYRFSVRYRHDMAFVAPSTITDIYHRWKSGQDPEFDLDARLLPVFANITVCAARVDRPSAEIHEKLFAEDFRRPPEGAVLHQKPSDVFSLNELVATLMHHGATVSSSLTTDCTVLIGTEASGKRYSKAKEWSIPAVHPLWVFDSCLRGAALEFEDYELSLKGFNPYNTATYVWNKLYDSRLQPTNAEPEKRDRPLLKKSSSLWSSIMDSRPSTRQVQNSTWEEDSSSKRSETPDTSALTSTLFAGLTFFCVGLSVSQQNVLQNVVESHSGHLASSPTDARVTHLLVLARSGPKTSPMIQSLPKETIKRVNNKEVEIVTDWFIERSVFYNRLCRDSWSRPLPGLVPSKKRYKVCVSGFTGVELLHIEKLVGYLHMDFCDVLNSKRDLLVINVNLFRKQFQKSCPKILEYKPQDILECPVYTNGDESKSVSAMSTKNKINAAQKWGIHVVSLAFFWEMLELSVEEPGLKMPDIADPAWCLFAPKDNEKFGPVKADQTRIEGSGESETMATDSVKLPSPRKSKERRKYGRLIGGGESLTEKLKRSRDESDDVVTPNDENEELLTQVGYGYEESMQGNSDLMEKLEGKRRRVIE